MLPINKLNGREALKERLQSNQSAKTCSTSESAANKQAKRQGNAKRALPEQQYAQKHALPANMRPINKQKGRETLKESLPSNHKDKNMSKRQTCGQ